MKKIGMIGGLSWVSTAEYYRRVNEIIQDKVVGVTSARLILESVNRQDYWEAVIERQDEEAAGKIIIDAAIAIERGGAEFIVITCNDAHRFVPRIHEQVSIPLLHIADATAEGIKKAGLKTVALTGVRKTMEGDFYPEILKHYGIETIIPNEEEKTYIHDTIFNELCQNVFTQSTRESYARIFKDLESRGAEGVVMGCTEIPLLLSDDDVDVKIFSTTELHCQAAVERALG